MATSVLVSVAEYLRTNHRPDSESIDGEIRERSVENWEPARLQYWRSVWFNIPIEPQLLGMEILSPDNTYFDAQERVIDYRTMSVQTIWTIEPKTRSARTVAGETWLASTRLTLSGPEIYLDRPNLFSYLDRPSI